MKHAVLTATVLMSACSHPTDRIVANEPAPPRGGVAKTAWDLTVVYPDNEKKDFLVKLPGGLVPSGFDEWSCAYAVQLGDQNVDGALSCNFRGVARSLSVASCPRYERGSDATVLSIGEGQGALTHITLGCRSY